MTLAERSEVLDQAWALSPSVAVRPEPFGALLYHFGTRRLTFLKRRDLADIVRGLADDGSARATLGRAEVPPEQWPAYAAALQALADTGMIERRAEVAG